MSDPLDDTTQLLTLDLPIAPTVLIVEDDELVLAHLKELVTAAGYGVRTAASGTEALSTLESSPASIVVTDLELPGMDGLELCRRIRERARTGYVYIILLTVRDEESDILVGLDAGADDYLSKRMSAAQFVARLRIAKRVLALEYSLKSALEKKHQLAMTDALTGAYNRRYFTRHLGRELKRAQRFGGHISLLLIDVDNFKDVNDTHGHVVGDMVLRRLTRLIAKSLARTTDWCARLGGDEFAVVLEGTHLADAQICAKKLAAVVAGTPMNTSAGPVRITVSIGICALEELADRNLATVLSFQERADLHLYASKHGGRNRATASGPAEPAAAGQRLVHRLPDPQNAKDPLRSVR